jgi:CheY-like chemotaxis protein
MAVLIVEDNPTNGLILRHLVAKTGMGEISVCQEPEQALHACETHVFDLMMVDHMLPGMTGVQFVRQVRNFAKFRQTPVVMVTADTSPQLREEALAAGVDTFLTKPIDALGFTQLIAKLMAARSPLAVPSI